MKANQAFKANDEAVSPVIGVILMVAITVVLAAVVFVLVSNLSETSTTAPTVSFTADDTARTLTVVSAPASPQLHWDQSEIVLGGSCYTTGNARLNGATASFNLPATGGAAIVGGDIISGCTNGQSFSITHKATNTLLYSHTFP